MNPKLFLLAIPLLFLASCDRDDDDNATPGTTPCNTGTLRCTNTSNATVQRIMISGTNYGSLDPGETRSIELAPGSWSLQFVGISGGSGCSASNFNIAACQTVNRSCSH